MLHEIRSRNLTVFLVRMIKFIWLPILIAVFAPQPWGFYVAGALVVLFTPGRWKKSKRDRFYNSRFYHLWTTCQERDRSLRAALKGLKKSQALEFFELPKTIDSVGDSLYIALRKADIVMHELQKSEGLRMSSGSFSNRTIYDEEAVALYQQAAQRDRDYNTHFSQILGSIEQAEGQAALYISSLDSLRVQVLKHRLGSRLVREGPQAEELKQSLSEAKMMLDSIDKALDELDASPFTSAEVIQAKLDAEAELDENQTQEERA